MTSSTHLARKLIEENADKMHAMAKALLEWETIDSDQLDDIMAGEEPQPPRTRHPARKSRRDDGSSPPPAKGGASATDSAQPSPSALSAPAQPPHETS